VTSYSPTIRASFLFVAGTLSLFSHPGTALGQSDYRLREKDVLNVTVADQPDLTKKYVIDDSGNCDFPLIGRVHAAGTTTSALTTDLSRRFGEFLTNPQVRVDVERTKRVFVFGGVAAPGMYQLSDNMTLIELLARAGYGGASEALIIRAHPVSAPSHAPAADPSAVPAGGDVIRVNLREFEKDLESGNLSRNVVLEEGDTVYVPRFDPNRIYVSGEVRNAGAYSVPQGTTVLQALTLAGGATPDAALGRIKILRFVNGSQMQVDVKLESTVEPGDTILVPRRYF
jgi:polysaccharide export outer membrane protein